MGLRVVQWATGGVGVAAIKGVLEHPDLELVGCWVHSADKAGKDVGDIIGTEPLGVTATNSVDEILALDADAVVYAPLLPNPDEVAALLRSGKNVVTPVGWVYPSERQSAPLQEAALEGSVTLHGTAWRRAASARSSADDVDHVDRGDVRSRRGVFRPAHL